jgi:tripartite-type tricarboxylate transporter receptor subunit TctC
VAGEVDFVLDTPAAVMPQVDAGKLRALAVSSAARSADLPAVPSLREQGVPDFDVVIWFGLLAPAGTPRAVIDKVQQSVAEVLARPELRQRLARERLEVVTMSPEAFGQHLQGEVAKWGEVVRKAGIKFD